MTHVLPWLTEHVRSAIDRCGATGASVYVPTPWNQAVTGLLVHVGDGTPLPEMATLEEARAFSVAAGARLGSSDDPRGSATAAVPSALPEGCLLPIPLLATLWTRGPLNPGRPADPRELRRHSDRLGGPPIVGWLGLRFQNAAAGPPTIPSWTALLELASALASTYVGFYGILTDPITGLPGRADLNGTLRAELDRAQTNGLPFSLVFVKLEKLDAINERHGRRAGDSVLREFLDLMHSSLRRSDTVMRYGDSVFALPLRDVAAKGAVVVGEKIRRRVSEVAFLDGAATLPCAVGVATFDGALDAPMRPLDLLRRADQALAVSERTAESPVVLWQPDGEVATVEHLDPLLGVFTGQSDKDYRNMRLLWDVLQALSAASGSELGRAVVERLFALFAATRVAFFERAADGALSAVAGLARSASGPPVAWLADDLRTDERQINIDAVASLDVQHREWGHDEDPSAPVRHMGVAVPLVIDGRALGTLYLSGSAEAVGIDATDVPVLSGVAAQLALALDRERLAEGQRQREQRERQVLRAELDRLRAVLTRSEFVFQSQPMNDLLATTRRVATTDATVLITGESGTGKELLAQTVHELSPRRRKPLVVVDCGAIPTTLIDSELFGRERGAYTGAERRSDGRLAQADGGTVFLDEIGELPLEVQAKLLRFVQEKTITMVGGTRSQRVDVRIIAATNRSLEHEVRAGHFREDLFHRLNVVRLRVPPLRERPADVIYLAQHFLDGFARQYGKAVDGFSPDALRSLEAHTWPGNVRELQNTVLQAVVLAEAPLIGRDHLQLNTGGATVSRSESPATPRPDRSRRAPDEHAASGTPHSAPTYAVATRVLSARLGDALAAANGSSQPVPPLGKWLTRDVILEAFAQSDRIAARAAAALRIPETTFSRRLRQAEADLSTTRTPDSWAVVHAALVEWLRSADRPAGSVVDDVDALLLGLIVEAVPDVARAAGLLGVTLPTMKRRLADYRLASADGTTDGVDAVGSLVE